ncbi:TRAP transporter substrate-binding protein [Thermodesulfobacteriota bacterium]
MTKFMSKSIMILFIIFSCLCFFSIANAEKEITLRISSFLPSFHIINKVFLEPWAKKIEKRTNGKLKMKLYPGGTLGKAKNQYDMVVRGVADIAWGVTGYTPGRFPLTSVIELPFMVPSDEIGCRIIQRLYDEGYLKNEFDDVKLLALFTPPATDLHTRKKLVKNISDFKGLKIRTPSPIIGELIKNWGGVPVGLPASEIYLTLERGVIDGLLIDVNTIIPIKADEVTKYHTKLGVSAAALFLVMNKKTYTSLPSDCKKAINEFSGEWWAYFHGKATDKAADENWSRLKKDSDRIIYTPSSQEIDAWKKAAQPIINKWIKDNEEKGLPARKVFDRAMELKNEFSKN